MIKLYFAPTPNARKVSIMLEELSLPYQSTEIDILAGAQFAPDFLALNPNNKVPVIVDPDGPGDKPITMWESGAILLYLAEKCGRLIPGAAAERYECLKWLMFQVASVGPMGGQHAFFRFYAREKVPMAIERYHSELNRQMRVMDSHLAANAYFAGASYSIADIAIFAWWVPISKYATEPLPALERWAALLAARPAVERGMKVLADRLRPETIQAGLGVQMGAAAYDGLYGQDQYARR